VVLSYDHSGKARLTAMPIEFVNGKGTANRVLTEFVNGKGTAYSRANRVREQEPASAAEVLFGQRVASLRAVLPQISGELLQLNER